MWTKEHITFENVKGCVDFSGTKRDNLEGFILRSFYIYVVRFKYTSILNYNYLLLSYSKFLDIHTY